MLDRLRRHASSWLIKGTLSLIILTFILFFGYTQITSRALDQTTYIAMVDDEGIPRRKFESFYEASLEQMRKNLKDEMPPALQEILWQSVLEQLVARELTVLYAQKLGIGVSKEEIANSIRSQKELFPDGNFDLITYQERFLPYYRQRYGEDFEKAVERDLLMERMEAFATLSLRPWQKELGDPSITSSELLSLWVNQFKESVKVELFRR